MKNIFWALTSILILSSSIYSQTSNSKKLDSINPKSNEELIAYIDSITKEIKANLTSCKKTQKIKDSTEYVCAYKKDSELLLISNNTSDPNQNLSYVKEWYFQNKQLIFVQQITTEKKSNSIFDKEKMYLNNENLFSWIQSGNKIDPNSEIFKKTAIEVRGRANELRIEYMK